MSNVVQSAWCASGKAGLKVSLPHSTAGSHKLCRAGLVAGCGVAAVGGFLVCRWLTPSGCSQHVCISALFVLFTSPFRFALLEHRTQDWIKVELRKPCSLTLIYERSWNTTKTATFWDKESTTQQRNNATTTYLRHRHLQNSFQNYFPEQRQYPAWIGQPFGYDTTTADINSPYLDDIIELQESEVQKRNFNTTNLQTFWCQLMESYLLITKVSFEVLTPFVTTIYASMRFLFWWK